MAGFPPSGLARPIDLRSRSNRFAVAATGAATLVGWLFEPQGRSWLALGGSAFLAWAVARELNPDRSAAAAAVLGPAIVATVDAHVVSLGSLFVLLLAIRQTAGTTGRRLGHLDLAFLAILTSWLAFSTPLSWIAGAGMAVALAVTGGGVRQRNWAWLTAIGVVLGAGIARHPMEWTRPSVLVATVVAAGVVGGLASWRVSTVESEADKAGVALDPVRIGRARVTCLAVALVAAALGGGAGMVAVLPAWTVLVVVGLQDLRSRSPEEGLAGNELLNRP
ncbi:MAG: hypothetical protein OEX04_09685 [Acidimicrobiia bacterium]|nr:hypothetical protein [Acidimicrobiia bacterium]MDH4307738.1 hypothetical protein [Acidimicrobiia bacterium]